MVAATVTGKGDLADILFLIAAIVFAVATLLPLRTRPVPLETMLIPAGLCLTAVAFWVL
jgi:hypothetical protein